jgi:transposase-like protein
MRRLILALLSFCQRFNRTRTHKGRKSETKKFVCAACAFSWLKVEARLTSYAGAPPPAISELVL